MIKCQRRSLSEGKWIIDEINRKLQQILFYRFEAPYKPVAIQGVVDNWAAK